MDEFLVMVNRYRLEQITQLVLKAFIGLAPRDLSGIGNVHCH